MARRWHHVPLQDKGLLLLILFSKLYLMLVSEFWCTRHMRVIAPGALTFGEHTAAECIGMPGSEVNLKF